MPTLPLHQGLGSDPLDCVVAVGGLVPEEVEVALGVEATAAVLDHHYVAVAREIAGPFGALCFPLAVGGALQQDWAEGRPRRVPLRAGK